MLWFLTLGVSESVRFQATSVRLYRGTTRPRIKLWTRTIDHFFPRL
jgi:hypothetical protein